MANHVVGTLYEVRLTGQEGTQFLSGRTYRGLQQKGSGPGAKPTGAEHGWPKPGRRMRVGKSLPHMATMVFKDFRATVGRHQSGDDLARTVRQRNRHGPKILGVQGANGRAA